MDLLFVFLGSTLAITLLSLRWMTRSAKGLPPSPAWGLPFIGHLHLLGKLPHQSLQRLALKHGGLMLLKLGAVRTLVVSSSDFAKEILKTNDHIFASRPEHRHFSYQGAGLIWAPYGEHWKMVRKLCTMQLLTPKQVEISQPVRRSELLLLLKELLQEARQRSAVAMNTKLSDLTFNIMMRTVTSRSGSGSTDPAERGEAIQFKNVILELFSTSGPSTRVLAEYLPWLKFVDKEVPKLKALRQFLDAYFEKEILRHRTHLQDTVPQDFMSVLLSPDKTLSDKSVQCLSMEMIAAGFETSAVTAEWALAELVKCPELLLQAQEELDHVVGSDRLVEEKDLGRLGYLNAIVKETLRLHPPGPLLAPHESIESCIVGNYKIPARTRVLVNAYAIGRDPAFWEEPLKFNPNRFLNSSIDVKGQSFEYIPFGSGRRSCPGVLLGMTTVQLVLASLLQTFDWSLPEGVSAHDLDMSEKFGLSVPKASPLKLIPTERLGPKAYSHMFGD